jgi:hypothetical protein
LSVFCTGSQGLPTDQKAPPSWVKQKRNPSQLRSISYLDPVLGAPYLLQKRTTSRLVAIRLIAMVLMREHIWR